jgi:hypothetical protein
LLSDVYDPAADRLIQVHHLHTSGVMGKGAAIFEIVRRQYEDLKKKVSP